MSNKKHKNGRKGSQNHKTQQEAKAAAGAEAKESAAENPEEAAAEEQTPKSQAPTLEDVEAEQAADREKRAQDREAKASGSGKKIGGHEQKSAAERAKEASNNMLGDLIDIARPIEIPDLPEDELELSVAEDRTRLVLEGILLLLATLALLFAAFAAAIIANYTGNVWLLIALILLITAVWFVSRRMGRFLRKYGRKTPVIDFGHKYIYIYEKSNPKEAVVVRYKDVKSYGIVRQGRSLRLLLWGSWVKHPSGYEYVGMSRPFHKDTLDSLESEIRTVMSRHHVKQKK